MTIIAIDPGTLSSAWVLMRDDLSLESFGIDGNERVLTILGNITSVDHLAIEMVASYGMPVGRETFETVLWAGRFIEAWKWPRFGDDRYDQNRPHTLVYRKAGSEHCSGVAHHLCKNNAAKDPNIRRAIIDRYPPTGGGKIAQKGTQREPGPLYGVSSHVWSAIAVGITWLETATVKT